jgi:hypothetical protein
LAATFAALETLGDEERSLSPGQPVPEQSAEERVDNSPRSHLMEPIDYGPPHAASCLSARRYVAAEAGSPAVVVWAARVVELGAKVEKSA